MIKRNRIFIASAIVLIILAFVSFVVAYGYDEGTFRNKVVGEAFTWIFTLLCFPFVWLIDRMNLLSDLFVLGMIFDVIFYAYLIHRISAYLSKRSRGVEK